METIIKLITLNKTPNTVIYSKNIISVLSKTLCNKNNFFKMMHQIKLLQWNAQSLICNRHILTKFMYHNSINIAVISETWLKSQLILKMLYRAK